MYSAVPLLSSTAAFGLGSYLGFGCLLVGEIPTRRLLVVVLWTLAALCAVNLLAALVLPEIAWYEVDPINEPGVVRFQGISGHPNTLARISSVFAMVVIAVAYYRYVRAAVWIPLAILAVCVTLATESRTAVLALLLSIALQVPRRYLIPIVILGSVIGGAILLTGQVDAMLTLVGRNGSVDEAESMSGRTDLWQFAWDLIVARPLTGYGFNSFEAFAGTLWSGPANAAVVATHSNYLSVLYSTGIFGAVPFLVGFAYLLRLWWSQPNLLRDLFVFNVLITGFSETDVFTTITTIPSLIFFIIIALDAKNRIFAFNKQAASIPTESRPWR
jgi:O-antigen ligase